MRLQCLLSSAAARGGPAVALAGLAARWTRTHLPQRPQSSELTPHRTRPIGTPQGKVLAWMTLAWGLGGVTGPFIGGVASQPCARWPHAPLCADGGLFRHRWVTGQDRALACWHWPCGAHGL